MMFGRRKDENLEEYNEKYAAKYDDDYIAPSEEYRSECDHDHEQSYSNINTVRECEHNHEQTYNDADTEQKPYDNYVNIENFFEKMLVQGEHLIWVGSRGNAKISADATFSPKNNNGKNLFIISFIMTLIGIFFHFLYPLAIIGILMIVILFLFVPKTVAAVELYALTDQRVILSNSWDSTSVSLKDIKAVHHKLSGKNTGDVCLTTDHIYSNGQKTTLEGYLLTLRDINDPARVAGVINDVLNGFF